MTREIEGALTTVATLIVCLVALGNCSSSTPVEPSEPAPGHSQTMSGHIKGTDPVPEATYSAWRERRSYYALLEIVDSHYIDPCRYQSPCPPYADNERPAKDDLIRLLGNERDAEYPGAGSDTWVYSSTRHRVGTENLVVRFDRQGLVSAVEWVTKRSAARQTGSEDPVPESTYMRWRERRSYYAILEILDAHINPCPDESPCRTLPARRATKADVARLLGSDRDDGYPNAGPDMWVYPSDRRIGVGHYLMITFDRQGMVDGVGSASE
ncbi:MAG TPA: hypothetical protein VFY29_20595 [Terriglobia bacterium]|nr:hypothetical protein [Terriglobia bacterium]